LRYRQGGGIANGSGRFSRGCGDRGLGNQGCDYPSQRFGEVGE